LCKKNYTQGLVISDRKLYRPVRARNLGVLDWRFEKRQSLGWVGGVEGFALECNSFLSDRKVGFNKIMMLWICLISRMSKSPFN
jgi:hypothetical protein